MLNIISRIRRVLLKIIVPEIIWPKFINIDGAKIPIRNSPFSFGIKLRIVKGLYEKPERILLRHLDTGSHVIEFGGSIGILSAIISKKIGSKGKLISIEADNNLVRYTKKWLVYPNVKIINGFGFPIYNRLNLYTVFDNSRGSLAGRVNIIDKKNNLNDSKNFFLSDLNNYKEFIPTVLIIDIEGSEEIILNHRPMIPNSIKKIFIELHGRFYGKKKENKIIYVLSQEGFKLVEKISTSYYLKRN